MSGSPWPHVERVRDDAIAALPAIRDALAADVIVALLEALQVEIERRRALEQIASIGLGAWHDHEVRERRRRQQESRA